MKNIGKELDYNTVCAYLAEAGKLGSRPGLENILALCRKLGNPQNQIKCIHVAGTNGKGSVSTMTAAVLHSSGYKTGLYVSPHIGGYRESMMIGGQTAGEEEFAEMVCFVRDKAREMEEEGMQPTEFELLTAAAFLWFYERGCDFAVIETGLGGRLDATNVMAQPLICVLTAISKDHTAILGDTIKQITQEKCGIIIQGGVTVVSPLQEDAAWEVIKKTAQERENALIVPDIEQAAFVSATFNGSDCAYKGFSFHLPLIGRHQLQNAVTVIETVRALDTHYGYTVTDAQIRQGLQNVSMPARQEVLRRQPLILLDGAHNPQGIEALCATMDELLQGKRITAVMGILKDKEYRRCIEMIASRAEMFIAVEPPNARALSAVEAADVAKDYCGHVLACDDYAQAVREAVSFAGEEGAVVICGSLYMAASMREAILAL
jgi:dihydrofolate synthase/folylpolyglutamate synthase